MDFVDEKNKKTKKTKKWMDATIYFFKKSIKRGKKCCKNYKEKAKKNENWK